MELEMDKKWNVEYYKNNNEVIVDQALPKHTVYIFQCQDSVIQVCCSHDQKSNQTHGVHESGERKSECHHVGRLQESGRRLRRRRLSSGGHQLLQDRRPMHRPRLDDHRRHI